MSVHLKGFFNGMNKRRIENSRITGFLIGKPIKIADLAWLSLLTNL